MVSKRFACAMGLVHFRDLWGFKGFGSGFTGVVSGPTGFVSGFIDFVGGFI